MKTDDIDFKPKKGEQHDIMCWKCEKKHSQVCVVAPSMTKGDMWTAFECPATTVWNEVQINESTDEPLSGAGGKQDGI